jgi:hypothetical protein
MDTKIVFKIGDRCIAASYDDWEALFDQLDEIFGVGAVQDENDPEQTDLLDVECLLDVDLGDINN